MVVDKDDVYTIPYFDIVQVVCDKPYISLETKSGKKYHFAQSLNGICSGLPTVFVKCNKSVVVNLIHVSEIRKSENGYELFVGGRRVLLSRRKANEIKEQYLFVKSTVKESGCCVDCEMCKITV